MMTLDSPEVGLALSYAPTRERPALDALFKLDETLGAIVRTTRDPMVGQMRLTWWYEALGRLDTTAPPAEPVLRALHQNVLRPGVTGAMLAMMTDGWDALLESTLDQATIERFAVDRGRTLFNLAGRLLSVEVDAIGLAGEGWALADLSSRLTDTARAVAIAADAGQRLQAALRGRLPGRVRALGAMALLAQFDLAVPPVPVGHPRRVGRLLLHRLTGY